MTGAHDAAGAEGPMEEALRAFYARERAELARLAAGEGAPAFGADDPEGGAMAAAWSASATAWERTAGATSPPRTAGGEDGAGAVTSPPATVAREDAAGAASPPATVGGEDAAGAMSAPATAGGEDGDGAVTSTPARGGGADAVVAARRPATAGAGGAARVRRRLGGWALAAAALLAVAAGWWLRGDGEGRLVVKGADGARLVVVASRPGGEVFVVEPDAHLATGDRIGFFVDAPAPGAVAVYLVDSGGATRLAPTGGRGGDFAAGPRVPLPEGARLTDGARCEWVVAAFGAGPLPLERLDAALAPGDDVCRPPLIRAVEGVRWQQLRVQR